MMYKLEYLGFKTESFEFRYDYIKDKYDNKVKSYIPDMMRKKTNYIKL